jgi:hypothetical protein
MNIFVLDTDVKKASEYHCDKHIVKMPLETAQMLCTAHSFCGLEITPYKPTHKNHPCNLWLIESIDNYRWLVELGLELCNEYSFRYGKTHKCQQVIQWCKDNEPKIESKGITMFALAMPDEYKDENPITSYRNYYIHAKKHLHTWKNRNKPQWL